MVEIQNNSFLPSNTQSNTIYGNRVETWGTLCFQKEKSHKTSSITPFNSFKPKNVIGYNRGGAIAYLAIHSGLVEYKPYVYFLAAAWKKFHDTPFSEHSNVQGVGTDDARVPLRWSLELSRFLNLPLIILYEVDHIGNLFLAPFQESILSYAQPVPSDIPWEQMPEWTHRIEYGSKKWNKYVRAQRDWVKQYWFPIHPPLIWDKKQSFVPLRKKN